MRDPTTTEVPAEADSGATLPDGLLPEIRGFLDVLGTAAAPPFDGRSVVIPEMRRNAARSREPLNIDEPPLAEIRDFTMATAWGSVGARLMRRKAGQRGPAIVYVHGGGWVIGSIDTHRRLMAEYAAVTGFAVIGIDYALAPEAPFPAAVYQCAGAIAAVRRMADDLAVDPARIAVAGDSAGANLAVGATLALADAGAPPPAAAILSYGVFDNDFSRDSYRRHDRPGYLLSRAKMEWFWDRYLPQGTKRNHPLAAPLHADLAGLPPCHLSIAELDVLADENHAFAARARRAGVPLEVLVCPGTVHGFLEGVAISPAARTTVAEQCRWLRERLG